jgi:hypothetical protein
MLGCHVKTTPFTFRTCVAVVYYDWMIYWRTCLYLPLHILVRQLNTHWGRIWWILLQCANLGLTLAPSGQEPSPTACVHGQCEGYCSSWISGIIHLWKLKMHMSMSQPYQTDDGGPWIVFLTLQLWWIPLGILRYHLWMTFSMFFGALSCTSDLVFGSGRSQNRDCCFFLLQFMVILPLKLFFGQ